MELFIIPSSCACDANYPVVYQIGRGKNKQTNPTLGSQQAVEPVFIWNNTKGGSPLGLEYGYDVTQTCKNYCNDQSLAVQDFIKVNREYCTHNTSTSCNGVTLSYTPYTCPHPLAGSGSCNPNIAGKSGYLMGGINPPRDLKTN